jgi:hypothetical protein
VPIRYQLAISSEAKADLAAVWRSDPESAGVLQATLEQIQADQLLLEILTVRDFGAYGTEAFHVDRWVDQQRRGRNLWRLKVWELEGHGRQRYRVVYTLDPRFSRYFVLGIFTRDFEYDPKDARTRRVLAAYDRLGIPNYQ